MKTKKEFLANCSNPALFTKVLNAGGVNWSDLMDRPSDSYDASSGAVPGMIYYVDTNRFAKKHLFVILQAVSEFEQEFGVLTNKPDATDETQFLNWLSWFAWENMMSELISFSEN